MRLPLFLVDTTWKEKGNYSESFTPQSVSFGLYPVIKQIVSRVPNCAVQFHYDIITRSRCRGPAVPTEKLDTQSMWETNLKGPVFLQLTLSPPTQEKKMLCHKNFPQPTTATTTPSSSKATAAAARNNHQTEIKNNPQNKQTNKLAERDVCNDVYVITREIKEAKRNRLVYFVDHCIHPSIHPSIASIFLSGPPLLRKKRQKKKKRGKEKRSGQMEQEKGEENKKKLQ